MNVAPGAPLQAFRDHTVEELVSQLGKNRKLPAMSSSPGSYLILSKSWQTWLPFVDGLVLVADGGFHTAGAFVHGGHVVSAERLVAKPTPARRLEDAGFHDLR